jgi:chemotaxis protein CheX
MSQERFIQFSKPFIDAAKKVFETMVFTKLEIQKPFVKKDQTSHGDVTAVIGLTGQVKREGDDHSHDYAAQLVVSFPYKTYINIASAMLMDNFTEYSAEIADVAGEICNMVMGNAKRVLAEDGYTCSMAIPSIVEGKDHRIKYPNNAIIIVMPIMCHHGEFFIEVCYREKK